MPPSILDNTLIGLYASHGIKSPIVVDLYHSYTHIDLHPQIPRERVFPEDEDPKEYGKTEDELTYFKSWALCFKTVRLLQMIGPADVILYTPNNNSRNIERALATIPKTQRPLIRYVDLYGDIQAEYKCITKGKKLVYWRPKWWMNEHDCIVEPEMSYKVMDKRYLFHPGIPTPEMNLVATDNPVLKQKIIPFVVKFCRCSSGQGTFLVTNENTRKSMTHHVEKYQRRGGSEVLVSDYIQSDKPTYGVNFFIGAEPRGEAKFLGANEQIAPEGGAWIGGLIDYRAQESYETIFRETINAVAQSLPATYVGWVGIDVMFDSNNKDLVVDLNPRIAGGIATVLFKAHFLTRGFNFAEVNTFKCRGPPERIYSLLASKIASGQIIINLAAEITENSCMVSILWGGITAEDIQAVQEWIKKRLDLCE